MCCKQFICGSDVYQTASYINNLEKFETILSIMNRYTPGSFYCHEHELVCNNGVHPKKPYSCSSFNRSPSGSLPLKPVRSLIKLSAHGQDNQTNKAALMRRTFSSPITKSEDADCGSSRTAPNIPVMCALTYKSITCSSDLFSPTYAMNPAGHGFDAQNVSSSESELTSYDSSTTTTTSSIISGVSPFNSDYAIARMSSTANLPPFESIQENAIDAGRCLKKRGGRNSIRGRVSSLIQQYQKRRDSKKQERETKRRTKAFRCLSLPEKRRIHSEAEATAFLQSRANLSSVHV